MAASATESTAPFLAKLWLGFYRSVPFRVSLPFTTNLDISFAVCSALFLTTIRLYVAEPVLINIFGWPDGNDDHDNLPTKEAAASMTSICHSTLLCVGLIVAFLTQPYSPASSMKPKQTESDNSSSSLHVSPPQWWREFVDALLQFCTGYMIYDSTVNILRARMPDNALQILVENHEIPTPALNDDDVLFLAHHMMTTFYMTTSRLIGAGHQSAMICMLLGELSNPLHNSYMIGELAMKVECCNGPTAQSIHYWVSVTFALVYNLLRVVIGPIMLAHVSYALVISKERKNIPIFLRVIWVALIWGVVFGSSSWIQKCHGIVLSALADYGYYDSSAGGSGTTSEL